MTSDNDALLIHLSDLHFCQPPDRDPGPQLRDHLCAAIAHVVGGRRRGVGIAITGDLVDSSDVAQAHLVEQLGTFLERLRTIAPTAPIVLLPGNHDRRRSGIFSPWSTEAVDHLREVARDIDQVFVFGARMNERLAVEVPQLSAVLGANVVAYDSTHTLAGHFSAGGYFRSEDLLALRGIVASREPVILLLHHHLVPTPVTDVEMVDGSKSSWFGRQVVGRVLPWLVTFGNREELFMTALGAGTALTLLHSLGSATLVLHGHKHYPTARLLRATQERDGDVLLASAGSAGLSEPYRAAGPNDRTSLWPSFNAIRFEGGSLAVDTIFFSPRRYEHRELEFLRQPLVRARQNGTSWESTELVRPASFPTTVVRDEATFSLSGIGEVWDFECTRAVDVDRGSAARPYEEAVEALPRSMVFGDRVALHGKQYFVTIDRGATTYRAQAAICRTVSEARRQYVGDDFSPFEWVGLLVRRGAATARLVLRGLPNASAAFGTVTDLSTGQQRPAKLEPVADGLELRVDGCAARRLLRIHWPLEVSPVRA